MTYLLYITRFSCLMQLYFLKCFTMGILRFACVYAKILSVQRRDSYITPGSSADDLVIETKVMSFVLCLRGHSQIFPLGDFHSVTLLLRGLKRTWQQIKLSKSMSSCMDLWTGERVRKSKKYAFYYVASPIQFHLIIPIDDFSAYFPVFIPPSECCIRNSSRNASQVYGILVPTPFIIHWLLLKCWSKLNLKVRTH